MAKVVVAISFDPGTIKLIDDVSPDNRSACVNRIVKCCLQWCDAERCFGRRRGAIPEHVKKISSLSR